MAHGDGTAVDVDLGVIDIEGLFKAHDDRGESFVDFKEVDVADAHAAFAQDFLCDGDGACEHDGRVCADLGGGADARARLKAELFAQLFVANQDSGCAIDDA